MADEIAPEEMLPDVALQIAARYRQPSVEGCQVFMLTQDWQEKVLVRAGYAQVARTPAEIEALLDEDEPTCIIIPDDAAVTNASLQAVLSRHSAQKTILWGVASD